MQKFLRYLRGYVCFIITGAFPQRLLNSCKNQKIPLWDISSRKNEITAKTYASQYPKLKKLRKNRNPKIRVKEKHGLPFEFKKIKKRYGIFAGVLLAVLLIYFLTSRVWIININTDDAKLKEKVETALSEIGAVKGMKKQDADTRSLKRKLMITENDIAWDSFNLKGCVLNIELNKRTPPPESDVHKNRFADVIAACDGQIIYSEIKNGQVLFYKGQTVSKGDILVTGTMVDKFGGIRCVYADGKIYAICRKNLTAAVPKEELLPFPDGKSFFKISFILGDKKIPLSLSKDSDSSIKLFDRRYSIYSNPHIGFIKEVFQPVKYKSITYKKKDILNKAEKIFGKQQEALGIVKLISSDISVKEDNKFFYITKELSFVRNIAIIREF